ncbi:MAG: shikimate dehydrogenase (NADP+) [Elusimicrobia bacterium]|nr:shikimate dehydrogenase (NADP+) [Elusimicrobiota bacterium]
MQKKIIKAGLLGFPLSGSLSPGVFRILSGLAGAELRYEPRECAAAELDSAIRSAEAEGWAGFNVTIPHKRAVFKMLDLSDPASRAVKAVNAVRFGKKGLEGLNTDAAAILLSLEENGADPAGKDAVVFGSGGSAAAAGWALGRARSASVTFRARNRAAALELAGDLAGVFPKTVFSAAPFDAAGGAGIFVNATPLGMYAPGRPPAKPGPGDFCLDLAYTRSGTEFLKAAAAAGAAAIDGLEVLVRQAALSLKFWTGLPGGDIVEFNREALKLLREKLGG